MYITPHTDVQLMSDCPVDPNYINTLYFSNKLDQTAYFTGKIRKNLHNYSYQRYAKNIIRVQVLADELYNIDYMRFRNSSYGDKWFYAFVDKVEYVNDVTTEIYYHIDDIQTWMFDWVLKDCFIERTHTLRDRVGDSITPEPVEVGEYVYNEDYRMIEHFKFSPANTAVVLAITDIDMPTATSEGRIYDGIYGACKLYAYTATEDHLSDINNWITIYKQMPDSIVSIYMCPADCIPSAYLNTGQSIGNAATGRTEDYTIGDCGTKVDGHIVRNKKLLTYPYNFANVNNSDGANLALRYEFFDNNEAKVILYSTLTQPVQVNCVPYKYKRTVPSGQSLASVDMDERLTLTNYPMCSWNLDAWKVWIAQNSIPIIVNAGAAAASLALSAYTPASTATSSIVGASGQPMTTETPASFNFGTNASIYGLHQISNILTNMYKASIAADITKGNISSGTASQAHGVYGFWAGRMSVTRQQAEVIDSFFDRYGYAVNKIDTPRLHNRKEWTYIKTIDFAIGGDIPAESKRNIENIFNSGITFWANPEHVGDYGYPNEPFLQ